MKEKILKLREDGKTYPQIQEELGCSRGTISYHCGIGQKEKSSKRKRKLREGRCVCGNKKLKQSPKCRKCFDSNMTALHLSKTRLQFTSRARNCHKFFKIRHHAKKVMQKSGQEKSCKVCNFDIYVEVCHIKAISDFTDQSLLSEINALTNLVYLCPNHHVLLDKGLIEL